MALSARSNKHAARHAIATLVVGAFVSPVFAGDVYIQTQPDMSWYARMIEQRRQQNIDAMSNNVSGLQNAIAARKIIVNSVLVIECGKAKLLVRTFGDGHIEQTPMGGQKVSDLDLATIEATYPALKIVRGCDE
jgi:hypothetical protein